MGEAGCSKLGCSEAMGPVILHDFGWFSSQVSATVSVSSLEFRGLALEKTVGEEVIVDGHSLNLWQYGKWMKMLHVSLIYTYTYSNASFPMAKSWNKRCVEEIQSDFAGHTGLEI